MNTKTISENRQARHEYFIIERFEAGIELFGTEVKSIRQGGVNLKDSWISIENGEAFIRNMHISPYDFGNRFNPDPKRPRKLLLHKREIMKLHSEIKEKGLTLIPLKVYFTRGMAKVELGLAKGKKLYGFIDDMRPCYEKYIGSIHKDEGFWRDDNGAFFESGCVNLMISGPAKIAQGGLEQALQMIKKDLEQGE